jgi:hypothetical protein
LNERILQFEKQVTPRESHDTMEALGSLLSKTCADISEIRLMMDVLLEVYLGKLILVFSI